MFSLFSSIALVALFFTLPTLAAPTESSLTIDYLRAANRVVQQPVGLKPINPVAKLLRDRKRYGFTPSHEELALSKRIDASTPPLQSGTVPAEAQPEDTYYLSPVSIGGQRFMLDFDTGSAQTWVFSNAVDRRDQPHVQNFYEVSGKLQMPILIWHDSYGDGRTVQGVIAIDDVAVGGVVAPAMPVGIATSATKNFFGSPDPSLGDGLFGLGFRNLSHTMPVKPPTFMDVAHDFLLKDLFTVALKHNASGSYDFGFIDQKKYVGDIIYTAVKDDPGYWQIEGEEHDIQLGPKKYATGHPIVLDTGSSHLIIPEKPMADYYKTVKGAEKYYGAWVVPCTTKLPDLNLSIDGHEFAIPVSKSPPIPNLSNFCLANVQSARGLRLSIIGDQFFKTYFTVFDRANMRVGFAKQA